MTFLLKRSTFNQLNEIPNIYLVVQLGVIALRMVGRDCNSATANRVPFLDILHLEEKDTIKIGHLGRLLVPPAKRKEDNRTAGT